MPDLSRLFGAFTGGPFHVTAFDGDTFHIGITADAGITIGGVDVHTRVRVAGLTVRDILNDAPNTCTFTIEGDGPAVGQAIRITIHEGLRVLFAGTIQTVEQSYEGGRPDLIAWRCTAIDDTARANYRRPFGTFLEVSATTIAQGLVADYAPAFSDAGIAADLPAVTIIFDGAASFIACLTQLATAIGGYAKVEDGVVYLFLEDPDAPPDPIDVDHPFLNDPPIAIHTDSSQLRTRVYGKGYGETVRADLDAGETLFPIQDGVMFPPLGGQAIAGVTADGAQSERIAFTGVALRGAGTLVGPGASPSNAPTLALQAGAGVTDGAHDVTVVHVTATGKSLAGPVASISVPAWAVPGSAPVAGTATTGTGPDQGSHDYQVTFTAIAGETTPSATSNAITTSAAVGQVSPPGALTATVPTPLVAGNLSSTGSYEYVTTFVNAVGETTAGAVGVLSGPGLPTGVGLAASSSTLTTGGSMALGSYRYWFVGVCANGFEIALGGANVLDVTLTGTQSAVVIGLNCAADARITKRRLYRTKVGFLDPLGSLFAQGGWPVGDITNNTVNGALITDTLNDSALTSGSRLITDPALGTDPGIQGELSAIPIGPAGVTGRRIYRRIYSSGAVYQQIANLTNNTATTHTDNDGSPGADVPTSNTTGTAVQRIPLTAIPIGPAGTTARKIYRRFNGAGTFKLVTTIANNTSTTFTDTIANASLGANAPASNTATGNQIALTAIPTGAAAVTQREIYMSPAGGGARRRVLTIADNVTTTGTITMSDATLAGQITEPASDTSGLTQPTGQVNPGSATLPVASAGTFLPGGGWVELGGGQVVRYTGVSGQTLTGIPATGSGSITTTVLYGQQAIPAPMLTGVTGLTIPMLKGGGVHIWVQRDDLAAQAEQAARDGTDGIIEYLISDGRRGLESLTARCDADLALFSRPIVTAAYATRDIKTRSGKPVTIALASPAVSTTVTIQEVTITEIDLVGGLPPRFSVRASSVRFSLEDTLRQLIVREVP